MSLYWNFDEEQELFDQKVGVQLDDRGLAQFPWVVQVPLKDMVYMVNVTLEDFVEERDAYMVRVTIAEENQQTGENSEHILIEECVVSDFETYIDDIISKFADNGFCPADGSDFELDIYDWVNENSDKKISDEIFTLVITKCKEAESIFLIEAARREFIKKFDDEIKELEESA